MMSVMWSLLPLNKDVQNVVDQPRWSCILLPHHAREQRYNTHKMHFTSFYSFQVTIGVFGHEEKVIYEPLTPAAIQVIFRILNKGLFNPIKISLTS